MLKDHVLNRLMTGRCPSKYCSYCRSSTRFFSKIASIFKKLLHLKDLNSHLECTGVSFNPEKAPSPKSKSDTDRQTDSTDRQTDRQSDKVTTVTLSRMRAEG